MNPSYSTALLWFWRHLISKCDEFSLATHAFNEVGIDAASSLGFDIENAAFAFPALAIAVLSRFAIIFNSHIPPPKVRNSRPGTQIVSRLANHCQGRAAREGKRRVEQRILLIHGTRGEHIIHARPYVGSKCTRVRATHGLPACERCSTRPSSNQPGQA